MTDLSSKVLAALSLIAVLAVFTCCQSQVISPSATTALDAPPLIGTPGPTPSPTTEEVVRDIPIDRVFEGRDPSIVFEVKVTGSADAPKAKIVSYFALGITDLSAIHYDPSGRQLLVISDDNDH